MHEYKDALKIAKEIQFFNKPMKLKIVGSLARKENKINDIDFITDRNLEDNKKYIKFQYKNYHIDVWHYDDLNIGYLLRTYPTHILIAIRKGLKKIDYKLTNNVYDENNNIIKNITIKQIFDLANIKYRKPTESSNKIIGGIEQTISQGVIFDKKYWDWHTSKIKFKELGFKLLKGALPRETDRYIRYRTSQPDYKKYKYYIRNIGKGINEIYGYEI